jgi:hypothetical protein
MTIAQGTVRHYMLFCSVSGPDNVEKPDDT